MRRSRSLKDGEFGGKDAEKNGSEEGARPVSKVAG